MSYYLLMLDYKQIIESLENDLKDSVKEYDVLVIKSKFLGKNSEISNEFMKLKSLNLEEKRKLGPELFQISDKIEKMCANKIEEFKNKNFEKIDTWLPVYENLGYFHIMPSTINKIKSIFLNMGFNFIECPEIETLERNFSCLNVDERHPCRAEHQTFFLENDKLLRTQTTTMQSYVFDRGKLEKDSEFSYFTIGRTFRCDHDRTHTPMFHQVDFMKVGKGSNLKNLMETIRYFFDEFFEEKLKYRFRPSYFPFTSPSFEVDVYINNRWLEILGSGLIHPNVYPNKNFDYEGFAAGMGVERLCMVKENIDDIRKLYNLKSNNFETLRRSI